MTVGNTGKVMAFINNPVISFTRQAKFRLEGIVIAQILLKLDAGLPLISRGFFTAHIPYSRPRENRVNKTKRVDKIGKLYIISLQFCKVFAKAAIIFFLIIFLYGFRSRFYIQLERAIENKCSKSGDFLAS